MIQLWQSSPKLEIIKPENKIDWILYSDLQNDNGDSSEYKFSTGYKKTFISVQLYVNRSIINLTVYRTTSRPVLWKCLKLLPEKDIVIRI